MKRHRVCMWAFPAAWRRQYERELLQLLAECPERRWQSVDLLRAGLRERVYRLGGRRAGTRDGRGWRGTGVKIAGSTAVAVVVGLASLGNGGLGSGTMSDLVAGHGPELAARETPPSSTSGGVALHSVLVRRDDRWVVLTTDTQARMASRQARLRSGPDHLSAALAAVSDGEMSSVAALPPDASADAPVAVTTSGASVVATHPAS